MKTVTILSVSVALTLLSVPTIAGDKGGKGPKGGGFRSRSSPPGHTIVKGGPPAAAPSVSVHVSIGADEQRTIQTYVDGYRKPGRNVNGLPPGLAKKVARGGELPPGWQKKCVPGAILSVELFRHCHPLPHELLVKLPPPPHGTILVALDGSVFRIHKETREIHAVFDVRL